jgi:hypothetical protein
VNKEHSRTNGGGLFKSFHCSINAKSNLFNSRTVIINLNPVHSVVAGGKSFYIKEAPEKSIKLSCSQQFSCGGFCTHKKSVTLCLKNKKWYLTAKILS